MIKATKEADIHLKLSHLCQLMDVPIASYYDRPIDKPETPNYLGRLTVIHNEKSLNDYQNQPIYITTFEVYQVFQDRTLVLKCYMERPNSWLLSWLSPTCCSAFADNRVRGATGTSHLDWAVAQFELQLQKVYFFSLLLY